MRWKRTRGSLVALAALLAPLSAAAGSRIEFSFARFHITPQDYHAVFTAVAIDQSFVELVPLAPRVYGPVGMDPGSRAYAANDLSDSSGSDGSVVHSFTIIPEPGSLALLSFGAALLALRRRRS